MKSIDELIIKSVQLTTGISNIKKNTRRRDYTDARKIAYKILRDTQYYSYDRIGELFNKDHATVLYNIKIANSLMNYDSEFKDKYLRSLSCVTDVPVEKQVTKDKILILIKKLSTLSLMKEKQDYSLIDSYTVD